MIRILHITNMMEQGGVDSLLLDLLPRLNCDATLDVELLVLDRSKCGLVAKLEKSGVKCHISKYKGAYDLRNICQIRKYSKGFDVVHIHLFPSQLYGVLAIKCIRNRPQLVTTEHCTTNNRRSSNWFRVIDRWMYGRYAKIVGVGQAATDNVTEWASIKAGVSQTILNGIDLSRFENVEPQNRTYLGVPEDGVAVVMVARFFDQKDQCTAIKAIKHTSSSVHLVLVGSGETLESCKALVAELGVSDRVHFLGRRDDVPSILSAADICLLSTHYEGIPISIIEYFASAKPVIATDVEGVREMIAHKELLCAPLDEIALGRIIERLSLDKPFLEQIGAHNALVAQNYILDGMVDKYNKLYKDICNKI